MYKEIGPQLVSFDSLVNAPRGSGSLGGGSNPFVGSHAYDVRDKMCNDASAMTDEQMADVMSRFAVPGQDPSEPIQSGGKYSVSDPTLTFNGVGAPGGTVISQISNNGLTVTNTTTAVHFLCCGEINRTASQSGGAWYVSTHGTGQNIYPMNLLNSSHGPEVFQAVDAQMRQYIKDNFPGC
jgi:hypothetical protein